MRRLWVTLMLTGLLNTMALAVPVDFAAPVNVAEINSQWVEWSPRIASDGLEIFFSSNRPGGSGDFDIWRATRNSPSDPFGTPVAVAELNSPGREDSPNLSTDGLTMYFTRDWAGHTAFTDIFVATRPDRSSAFSAPQPVSELNTADYDGSPCISADDLSMYFAINVSPYNEDIFYAHRQTASGPFGTPVELVELSTSWYERPNWLSSDELSICFASSRPSPLGSAFHIYVSTRSADTQPFGLPVMVGGINTEYGEAEASYDEARGLLYFVSDRPGGAGSTEIWVASAAVEVIPEPATLALVGAGLLALARRRGRK